MKAPAEINKMGIRIPEGLLTGISIAMTAI